MFCYKVEITNNVYKLVSPFWSYGNNLCRGKIIINTQKEQYLLVKGKAGLGNRILVLLDSLLYSDLSGRTLIIDWRDGLYSPYGLNAFSHLFSEPPEGNPQLIASENSVVPETWKGHLEKSVDKLFGELFQSNVEMDTVNRVARRYTIDVRQLYYSETCAVRWGWTHELYKLRRFFRGPYSKYNSLSDYEILRSVMTERVRPVDKIQTCIRVFRDKHFTDSVIGIHIRHSDRKNNYGGYYKHVDNFLRVCPSGVVFIATDNSNVELAFKARYPRVVATEKWYPPPGIAIHNNLHLERDALRNAREALIDLYLLGSCNKLIFNSTSSFGYLASLLSKAPSFNLVDMAPWSLRRSVKYFYRWVQNLVHSLFS